MELENFHGYVSIDFETANENRRSACALGMVKYDDVGNIVDTYYSLIHPHPEVDYFNPFNTSIHGIEASDVASAPEWDVVGEKVREFVGDLPLVAHNMGFDGYVLSDLMKLYGLEDIPNFRFCTLRLARKVLADKLESKSLDNVFDYYFPDDYFEHHQAYEDAHAAGRIFTRMVAEYGPDRLMELCPPTSRQRGRRNAGVKANQAGIEDLLEQYKDSQAVEGEYVTFTGTLKHCKRDTAQMLVTVLGGRFEKSLNKRTTMLVVGVPNPSSWRPGSGASRKLEKARQLNAAGAKIQILSEEEFFNQLSDAN